MKLYSWNINGYNTCNRFGGIDNILKDDPDIICFQEVKVSDPEELNSIFTLNYEKYYNFSNNKGHNGVFVYTKIIPEKTVYKIGYDRFDNDGRGICLEYEQFILLNLYMPHGGRDKKNLGYKLDSYSCLRKFVTSLSEKGKPLLLVGDFNIAYNELDLARSRSNYNNIMFTGEERRVFGELLSDDLVDLYRQLYPTEKEYTWWPYAFQSRKKNVGWRIDYMLASKEGFSTKELSFCSKIFGSDHCPIKVVFDINITDETKRL